MTSEAAPVEGLDSRRVAYRAVRRVHAHGTWSVQAVHRELERSRLDARDRAFAASLAYETLRWEGTLDWALGKVVRRGLDEVEPAVLDVLRIGAWQLLYAGVPDRAAVGTAVDTARAEIGARATGFVNGALRELSRRRDGLGWPSGDDPRALGLRLGYPSWVVTEAVTRFGARAAGVLEAGNRPPGVTLRVVPEPGDDPDRAREDVIRELETEGIRAHPGALAAEAVRAPGLDPTRSGVVSQGRAVVQDEASMLVARAVTTGTRPGTVADLCAGPGGKSTHLAQLGADVIAGDVSANRARLIAEAAGRLSIPGTVGVIVADALRPALARGSMDAVLVDAPCSGLGVVRRRAELRWRRSPDDPSRLATLQVELLSAAADLVRPGGRLVYSACTWTEAETTGVVDAFLAGHGDRFGVEDTAGLLGLDDPPGAVQLDPWQHDTDGMFIATFVRTRDPDAR